MWYISHHPNRALYTSTLNFDSLCKISSCVQPLSEVTLVASEGYLDLSKECLMKNHLFIYFLFCRLGGTICNFSSRSVSCNSELILSVFTRPASQATLIVTDTEPDPLQRLQRILLLIIQTTTLQNGLLSVSRREVHKVFGLMLME